MRFDTSEDFKYM